MTDDTNALKRRSILKTGAVVTAGMTGFAGVVSANGKGNGTKGGAGFTFTKPSVDTFEIVKNTPAKTETFQRGCGNGGKLQSYDFFHAVDSFDGDGETDRLYPHPSDKRFDIGDEFKINTVCETETGRDRPAYWLTFAPV